MLLAKWRKLLELALRASKRSGKSVVRQVVEIIRIRRRNPTLGATDYFAFRLYDPEHVGASRPEDYLGWRAEQQLALALNPRTAVTPAWDKLTFTLIAQAFDLPVPKLLAFYRSRTDRVAHVAETFVNSPGALAAWLRGNTHWPVFAKPSFGWKSAGCYYLAGYQSEDDVLLTRRGEKLPVERFVSHVEEAPGDPDYRREMGYLFQEVLRPHQEIARLTGSRSISGLRIVLIQDEAGVEVVAVVWKIAADQNHSDQFSHDFAGNLLAAVDPQTGRVGTVIDVRGRPTELPGGGPSTGSIVLPDWNEAIALCTRAAGAFPMMRIQHWDLALTDRGACLLELNDWGAIGALQCFGRGLLTDRLRALLRSRGDRTKAPWIGKLCG